jgi:carbon storage regulator
MLILTREVNERIVIGEGANQVIVMVCKIKGEDVRLGIEAPPHMPIHREEIYMAIQAERAASTKPA